MTTTTPTRADVPALAPQHLEFLRTRAISVDVALAHDVRSIDLGKVAQVAKKRGIAFPIPGLPVFPVTGLLLRYHKALDGIPRWRVRSDVTSIPAEEEGGNIIQEGRQVPRYLAQSGVSVIPYITNPAMVARDDTSIPVFIVEAPAKALSLVSAGYAAIGLGGVLAGGHDAEALASLRQVVAHAELRRLKWAGRRVYIVFDAGVTDHDDHPGNPAVAQGAAFLAKGLGDLRADVWLVKIPYFHVQDSEPESGKWWRASDQGPDDFIFRNGVEAFRQLVAEAVPADPVRRMKSVLDAAGPEDKPVVAARLMQELFFGSTLAVGGDVVISAVSAISKTSGVGKIALRDAAKAFSARARAKSDENNPAWMSQFKRAASGTPRATRENVELCLRQDEGLVGLVAFDEFGQRLIFHRPPPWKDKYKAATSSTAGSPWADEDDLRLGGHIAERFDLSDVDPRKLRAAVVLVGRDHPVHPVRDFLNQLKWDGTSRIASWLTEYLGVDSSEYSSNVGRWCEPPRDSRRLGCLSQATMAWLT